MRDAAAGLKFLAAQGPVASFARYPVRSLGHPRGRLVTSPLASTLSGRPARWLYNLRGAGACARGGVGLPGRRPLPLATCAPTATRASTRSLAQARAGAPSLAPPPRHVTGSRGRPAGRGGGRSPTGRGVRGDLHA